MRGAAVILFSVGLPGRFAAWCNAVIARLAQHLGGSVATTAWPPLGDMFRYEALALTLDEVARFMIGSDARHFVIGARQPDNRLRDALARQQTRFVLALDDPRDAVADILAETGGGAKAVVRAVANSCPLVMPFAALPGALAMLAADAAADPSGAVIKIGAHFGIPIGQPEAAAIVAALAPLAGWADAFGPEPAQRLPVGAAKMAEGALGGYRRRFAGERLEQLAWTRDLFYLAADAGRGPTEPIDVAGGSRILTYGPYIHLPPGSWTAQIVLGFSPEAAAASYLVDVYADAQLARSTFEPSAAGIFIADLTFSLGEPSGRGVEVRVWVTSDSAAGRLAFGHVVLRPLAMRDAGAAENFERVLEL